MTRTFVVGLDGASWLLLEPWIEEGELPNLAALRESGSWSTSRSCLPPVTFPNWKCYSSGKDPGGFGVFWFERVDLGAGRIETVDGSDFRTAELWDYLNDEGLRAGVVIMPTTYPPREIDGVVVCGGPDAVSGEYRSIDEGYTYPPALAERLEAEFDYRVHPEPLLSSNDERGAEVEAILDVLDSRFSVALDLFEREDLDFLHVTLFYLNVLHHFFWDDEPTLRAWRLVDEWLGRLAELPETNLYLMSDHGSAPTTTEFYVNEWLAEAGYQARTRTVEDYLRPLGVDRESALRLAKRAGVVDLLARAVPERLQQLVPQRDGVKRDRKLEAIDLARTKAVASGQGPIYLNPAFDVEAVRDELMADLRAVEDEQGPLFTAVHRGEDVDSGPYAEDAPEVVVDQRPGVHVNDGIGGGRVQSGPDRWAAENTPQGIFVASG
ncbi:MAG TPA: alkaline phosphatase family protein, partial [Halobacteriales archaeon]|nr:alkaline phosphatase family protein [Halobacteriales archaeon]